MPKLKPETQSARREHILDVAERCFAETGFHRTTMNDICAGAGISPGALYVYFDSKEALIAGITGRDRADFAQQLSLIEEAPDFLAGLKAMGDFYMDPGRAHKARLCIEMGLEATRNTRIGEIFWHFDREVRESLERLFQRLADEGRIAPAIDIASATSAFCIIADGVFWRHTVHQFGAEQAMPIALGLIRMLLNPVSGPVSGPVPEPVSGSLPAEAGRGPSGKPAHVTPFPL